MGQNRLLAITLSLVLIGGVVTPAFAQTDGTLYMVSKGIGGSAASQLWILDTITGVADPRPNLVGFNACNSMDFHPDTGVLYATCESVAFPARNGLISINPGTGIGTAIGPHLDTGDNYGGMSFHPSTKLLFAMGGGNNGRGLGTIDLGTGLYSFIGGVDKRGGNGLAFSSGATLYVARGDTGVTPDTINTVDISDGSEPTSTSIIYQSPLVDNDRTTAMDFSPNTGTLWAAIKQGNIFSDTDSYLVTLNPTTGAMNTPLLIKDVGGNAIDGVDGIAFLEGIRVGGTDIPIDKTSLILAGAQMTTAWLIPVIVAGIGFAIVIARKF